MSDDRADWITVEQLTKSQAEDLLDWLEAHGVADREVHWQEQRGFSVACRLREDDSAPNSFPHLIQIAARRRIRSKPPKPYSENA